MNRRGMIGELIGGLVAIIIAISMLPVINKEIEAAQSNTSNLGIAPGTMGGTVLQLALGLFVLGVLGVGIAVVVSGLKRAGLLGGDESDDEDEIEEEPKPKIVKSRKQTYEEYVRERQRVEGMLK